MISLGEMETPGGFSFFSLGDGIGLGLAVGFGVSSGVGLGEDFLCRRLEGEGETVVVGEGVGVSVGVGVGVWLEGGIAGGVPVALPPGRCPGWPRPERKFDSAEMLRAQIASDLKRAREILAAA